MWPLPLPFVADVSMEGVGVREWEEDPEEEVEAFLNGRRRRERERGLGKDAADDDVAGAADAG